VINLIIFLNQEVYINNEKTEKNNREKFENLEIDEESELKLLLKIFNKFSPLFQRRGISFIKKVKKGIKRLKKNYFINLI
jgi:hypothetical protein